MTTGTKFILMKETSFEYYCFILSNVFQNIDKMKSGFPPTSSHIYFQLPALLIGQIETLIWCIPQTALKPFQMRKDNHIGANG